MPVLAAMGKREARRIGEAIGRAMHHFGHHRERPHRARADAGNEKQFGEIGGSSIRRRSEGRVKARRQHVARAHVVMRGHDEMGQRKLDGVGRRNGLARSRLDAGELARQAVGTERIQKLELGPTGGVRAPIRQVDDLALMDAVDGFVRLLDETLQAFGQPMVAPSRAA
jgi:hypothetical protein